MAPASRVSTKGGHLGRTRWCGSVIGELLRAFPSLFPRMYSMEGETATDERERQTETEERLVCWGGVY